MRSLALISLLALCLTACPRIAVNFSTDPSIMRGTWTGTIKQICPANLSSLAWSPDSTRLVTIVTASSAGYGSGFRDSLAFWDSSNGTQQRKVTLNQSYGYGDELIGWKADGSGVIVVRRIVNGLRAESFDASSGAINNARDLSVGANSVYAFTLSRDLRKLAAVIVVPPGTSGLQPQLSPPPPPPQNLALVVWNLETGLEERRVPLGMTNGPSSLMFSPDGSRLAVAFTGVIRLIEAGPPRALPFPGDGTPYGLGWNADGSQLTAARFMGTCTWRVSDGSVVRDVNLGLNGVYQFAFSPDATRLAFSRDYTQLEVWNLETASKVFTANIEQATEMAFSPDGTRLAVARYGRCSMSILNASSGANAASITLEPLDPDRSITLNLTASFVDERGYAIQGTATIQNEPAYTVQGRGQVGGNEYLTPSAPPAPRTASLILRDANGATPWGAYTGLQYAGPLLPRYDGWWTKPDGKQYTVLVERTQP